MSKLRFVEYVRENAVRGACTCGQCIDAGLNPEEGQPACPTVDLVFFKVAKGNGASAQEFEALVESEFPHWLDGKEHNYLEMGADVGDQGIALMAMGLGHLLGVWELLTPVSQMPFLRREEQLALAGQGMVAIRKGVSG